MACLAVIFELFVDPETLTSMNVQLEPGDVLTPTFIVAALLSLPLMLIMLLAPIYSIIRPSRGVADLIAGTRLIRK
jgi:hypothetical protein